MKKILLIMSVIVGLVCGLAFTYDMVHGEKVVAHITTAKKEESAVPRSTYPELNEKEEDVVEDSYHSFMKNKKGYYAITTVANNATPVLCLSSYRFDGDTGVNACDIYQYQSGNIMKIGSIHNNSTSYDIGIYKGFLVYRSHHYMGFVTVENQSLSGVYYKDTMEKDKNGKWTIGTFFKKATIKNGKTGTFSYVRDATIINKLMYIDDQYMYVHILPFEKIS